MFCGIHMNRDNNGKCIPAATETDRPTGQTYHATSVKISFIWHLNVVAGRLFLTLDLPHPLANGAYIGENAWPS